MLFQYNNFINLLYFPHNIISAISNSVFKTMIFMLFLNNVLYFILFFTNNIYQIHLEKTYSKEVKNLHPQNLKLF